MAVLCLFLLMLGHLALTDIYHGEGDLAQEWRVLQLAAVLIAAFIAMTVATLLRVLRTVR